MNSKISNKQILVRLNPVKPEITYPRLISYCLMVCLTFLLFACATEEKAEEKPMTSTLFERLKASESGVSFSNTITETEVKNIITYEYFYNGGGVAAGDFNNDGLPDLYFTGNQVDNKLYLNKGDFKFEDITEKSRTKGSGAWANGVTLVDINSDGFLDIYVCNSGWKVKPEACRNELFVNNGDLTFTERAAEYGLDDASFSTQAVFFDMDQDNDLDMFLVNRPERPYRTKEAYQLKRTRIKGASDKLFKNENGKYVDVSAASGIIQNGLGYGLGVAVGDINKDGWPDIYVTNDYVEPDYIYFNMGQGRFSEAGRYAASHMSNFGMGVDISDVNNDNWPDIFVADMAPDDNYRQKTMMKPMNPDEFYWAVSNGFHFQYMFNTLHLNNKDNTFSDVAQMAGLATTDWSWSVLFEDLDNDAHKDLMITNGFRKEFSNKDFIKKADKKMGKAMNKSLKDRMDVMQSLLLELPETRLKNYLFRNQDDLAFKDVSLEWGFNEKTFSNGAAIVDLNQDGFLDIIINNIDEEAYIYRNTGTDNSSLTVKLNGPEGNKRGIGAKVTLYQGDKTQYKEYFTSRGFQSSIHNGVHFGLGGDPADSIQVIWPDGKVQTMQKPTGELVLAYTDATPVEKKEATKNLLFARADEYLTEKIYHRENPHNDYQKEVLLPHKMSQFGPAVSVGDINNDSREDFYLGGASGQQGRIFTQNADGTFSQSKQPLLVGDAIYEDVGSAFFDADGDGDLDLYVTSGGNEWNPLSVTYQDRLYFNNNGVFERTQNLPTVKTSNSIVRPYDIDNDGDLDLFVGARVHPKHYPTPGESWILQNEGGVFTDVSAQYLGENRKLGLITDARWGDLNGDGNTELVVVGEWTPIQVLSLEDGKLINNTAEYGFSDLTGWWYSVKLADLNDDGKLDILAGNLGLNYKYKASKDEPFHVFYNDFDENGTGDIVLGYHDDDGDLYPLRGRQCSSEQMPVLSEKFETYDEFGSANINEVYGGNRLKESLHLTANSFASLVLTNNGDGKFTIRELPRMAQISSINSFIVGDFDGDEIKDILYAGNLYPVEVETTRNDASFGGLLTGNLEGSYQYSGTAETGFSAGGDVKHLSEIQLADGSKGILIVRNDSKLDLFRHIDTNTSMAQNR